MFLAWSMILCATLAPSGAQAQARRSGGTALPIEAAGDASAHTRSTLPDLAALARRAMAAGQPLVVMFSLPGCPWCNALRREHIAPLRANQEALGLWVLELDLLDPRAWPETPANADRTALPDPPWLGTGSPRELGKRLGIRLAPTVVFLGPAGELAERLVGYGSPDFFGAYLEQGIAAARQAMAKDPPKAP